MHNPDDLFVQNDVQGPPRPDIFRQIAPWWHTSLVLAVVVATAFRGWVRADQMRSGVNPQRLTIYERTILFEWLVLGLVLLGVKLGGSPFATVLGDRWRSIRQFFGDAGIGLLFLVLTIMITSVLGAQGGLTDKAIQFLLPQGRLELAVWIALSISAGICEEAVYRGYLQRQFTALTRNVPAGIILSAVLFAAAHSYQGLARASIIGVMGAMGGILAYWRRSVRPGMIAHALQDILGGFVRH